MKKLVLLMLLALTLTACGGGMYIGTGQKFDGIIPNSEPDKSALVYFYRTDGWGYGKLEDKPFLINIEEVNSTEPKVPALVLTNKTFRPLLVEPKKMRFSVAGGSSDDLDLRVGETYCFEIGMRYRGFDVIVLDNVKIDDCVKSLQDMELVHSLNAIRKSNNAAPFAQKGFKEIIPEMSLVKPASK